MTIRKRLALWYSGLLALIIILLSAAVVTVSRVSVLTTIDNVLDQGATRTIQTINVVPAGRFGAVDLQIAFRSHDIFSAPGISIQVWQTRDMDGPIAPTLVRSSDDISTLQEPLDPATLESSEPLYSTTTINGIPARVVTRPVFSGGEQFGIVQVATPIQAVVNANDTLLVIIFIGAGISILVSIGLGMWFSRRALRPIEKITQAAASIADADDLSIRLEWDGPMDELGRLTRVFNHMMERLEHLFSVQQRFVSDVSHELRTPLTSILGNLEIMERYGVDKDSLDAVHREAGRMSRMVNDLLLLARADYGEMSVDLYPLELEPLFVEVYEQALTLAEKRDLKIILRRSEPTRITGNADRIKQLLLNLVSNAIKFTSDGGRVTLSLYRERDNAVIEVQDTGIGISDEDLKRIFDRFFQADQARVHYNETDGAGLGLSIARWIVDVHSGKIDVSSEIGKGTLFRVRLPLLDQQGTGRHARHTGQQNTHTNTIHSGF